VPDADFERFTENDYDIYLNAVLNPEQVAGKSLFAAGLLYESYLQNMGRQLFYIAAASYITIYLAVVFLIIANTIIGVQFLTWQQKTWIGMALFSGLLSSRVKSNISAMMIISVAMVLF